MTRSTPEGPDGGPALTGDDGIVEFPERSFLGGLGPDDLDALLTSGHRVARAPGQALCREGDPSSAVWFLLGGHVKLSKVALSGREVLLELRGPGDVVGEMGVIDGGARSASVIALGHAELLSLALAAFFEVLDQRAGIARRLREEQVARLRQASVRQLELGTAEVVGRLAQRLVELAGSLGVHQEAGSGAGPGVLIAEGISQQDLADWCGTSRDSVVRALRQLRSAGLVDSGRSRMLIRDLPALRALATSG